jgi:hypothetical protein
LRTSRFSSSFFTISTSSAVTTASCCCCSVDAAARSLLDVRTRSLLDVRTRSLLSVRLLLERWRSVAASPLRRSLLARSLLLPLRRSPPLLLLAAPLSVFSPLSRLSPCFESRSPARCDPSAVVRERLLSRCGFTDALSLVGALFSAA